MALLTVAASYTRVELRRVTLELDGDRHMDLARSSESSSAHTRAPTSHTYLLALCEQAGVRHQTRYRDLRQLCSSSSTAIAAASPPASLVHCLLCCENCIAARLSLSRLSLVPLAAVHVACTLNEPKGQLNFSQAVICMYVPLAANCRHSVGSVAGDG